MNENVFRVQASYFWLTQELVHIDPLLYSIYFFPLKLEHASARETGISGSSYVTQVENEVLSIY